MVKGKHMSTTTPTSVKKVRTTKRTSQSHKLKLSAASLLLAKKMDEIR